MRSLDPELSIQCLCAVLALTLGPGCFDPNPVGDADDTDASESSDATAGSATTGEASAGTDSTTGSDAEPSSGSSSGSSSAGSSGTTSTAPTTTNAGSESSTGDPSESSSDGTTGAGFCSGAVESVHSSFSALVCSGGADLWGCVPGAKSCLSVDCADPMDASTGWIRQPSVVTVEGSLNYTDAIEFAPPEVAGGLMSANFFPDLSGLCNPVFVAEVGCGYAAGCVGDYLVRVENLDDPDDFVETLAPESFDGAGSAVTVDLAPFADKHVVIVLGFFAGEAASAADVGVFGDPRIMVTN